jgi:hypothetical protein
MATVQYIAVADTVTKPSKEEHEPQLCGLNQIN